MKYITPQSIHRDFFYFYINSKHSTKRDYDKELVKKICLLITDGFDPLVWDAYNAPKSQSREAILNLIGHFVESAGVALSDPTYILSAVDACKHGHNLNIEFPSIYTTVFGQEFADIHSKRYGHLTDCHFDDEFPFTVASEEVFLPNIRGYKLNLNVQHLQRYQATRNKQAIALQGMFFNGAVFKLLVSVRQMSGGDTLSYKFKAKRCHLEHKVNGLNALFDITS